MVKKAVPVAAPVPAITKTYGFAFVNKDLGGVKSSEVFLFVLMFLSSKLE